MVWKDIIGFEGYQVSDAGGLRCLDKDVFNKANGTFSSLKGKCLKQDTSQKHYAQIGLWRDGKCKKFLVHRLVAIHFIPNPHNYPEVNHIDHDKTNNNATNLEWVTRKRNAELAKEMGKYSNFKKGSAKVNSKLTESVVLHIRQKTLRNIDYCKLYGVKPPTVTMIQKCKNRWSHVGV